MPPGKDPASEPSTNRHSDTDDGVVPGFDPLAFLPVAAYIDDIDDEGHIGLTYFSPRFAELTGIAPATIGTNAWSWDDHVHPDDLPAYQESFARLWHERREQDVEYRFERGPDDWVWLRDQASAAYDAVRRVTVIHGTLSDVTRRRAAEIEAARVHDELEATVRARTAELELDRRRAPARRPRGATTQNASPTSAAGPWMSPPAGSHGRPRCVASSPSTRRRSTATPTRS